MTPATPPPILPPGVTIRRATSDDAATVAALGARLFAQAYGDTHPDPELGEYLARAFVPQAIAEGIRQRGLVVVLVERGAGRPIGYAQLRPNAPVPADRWAATPAAEIQRFYLDRAWHGRGVARILMQQCLEEAREGGAEATWLQVWAEASWAIRFYEREGFRIAGELPFPWGGAVEQDWLMVRRL